jgi:transcriptional regulator with XRE-family HTH domain
MKKKNELGSLIRSQRENFRLTQRELAHNLGVKASHVAYIEGGLRRPSLSLVRRLAETLGLDKQKLLFMTYPESRFLITLPPKAEPVDPDAAWEEFAGNRAMLSAHSITPEELKVLRQVALLGHVGSPRNLLFVLNAIRQAVDHEDDAEDHS